MVASEIFLRLTSVRKCLFRSSLHSWRTCINTDLASAKYCSKAGKTTQPIAARNVESRRAFFNVDKIPSGLRNISTFTSGMTGKKLWLMLGSGGLGYATWRYYNQSPEKEQERLRKHLIQKMASAKLLLTPKTKPLSEVALTTKEIEVKNTELKKLLSVKTGNNIHFSPRTEKSGSFKKAETPVHKTPLIHDAKSDAVNVVEADNVNNSQEFKVDAILKSYSAKKSPPKNEVDQASENKVRSSLKSNLLGVIKKARSALKSPDVIKNNEINMNEENIHIQSTNTKGHSKKDGVDQGSEHLVTSSLKSNISDVITKRKGSLKLKSPSVIKNKDINVKEDNIPIQADNTKGCSAKVTEISTTNKDVMNALEYDETVNDNKNKTNTPDTELNKENEIRASEKAGSDQGKDRKVKTRRSKKSKTTSQQREEHVEAVDITKGEETDKTLKDVKDFFIQQENVVDQAQINNPPAEIINEVAPNKNADIPVYGGDEIKRKQLQSFRNMNVEKNIKKLSSATEAVRGYRRISPSPISKRLKNEQKPNAFVSAQKNKDF